MPLYVCATPIGHLEDVSLRLLATLREVALICAEDTRHTQRLLARHEIHTPLTSCHQHTPPDKIRALAARLAEGESMALVTNAGTPGVSDPGPHLVQAAAAHGVPVVPIPGPCALAAALSISGLDAQRFSFLGFLPRKPGKLRKSLQEAIARDETLVIYESPYRVVATLEALAAIAPANPAVVCRELTKKFEEVLRGTTEELAVMLAQRQKEEKELRGEFVIVVGVNI
ncbi:MAG: 16S rRNA (cytidine(1402)-2'-O)-methyltransferase [Armatimonadota bacterium]|nr:16S rRNA (cytidine(1402)-2'-O)-methyltransferase [Armatimonadota bacterium]